MTDVTQFTDHHEAALLLRAHTNKKIHCYPVMGT